MSSNKTETGTSSTFVVRQVRSVSGRTKEVCRTIQALGLGRIGDCRLVVKNAATIGMVRRVHQLVVLEESK